MPHSINHGDACLAYFNKIWGIPKRRAGGNGYSLTLKAGHFVICEVHVFPLKVSRQTKQWPERRQREVKWVSAKEAADAVQEPKLSAIIRHLARRSAE
jgi:hypothetical protein